MPGEVIYTLAFYILAGIALVAAAGVIFMPNLVHSALLLALSFIGVAGLYVLLQADFLAAVQVLVYSGAVAVIVVIGVMLTQRGEMNLTNPNNRLAAIAAVVTGLMTAVIAWAIFATPWEISPKAAPDETIPAIATALFRDYVVPFEAAAVLLLVAMIGAIILAKGAEER